MNVGHGFWTAAALSLANGLYGLFILPESLPKERRAPFRWISANPIGGLHLLRKTRTLAGLSLANFVAQIAHVALPSTFVLYATYRYGWDSKTVGLTLAMVGVCTMVVQGLAIAPIVHMLGERGTLLLGLCCGAIGFAIFGSAPTGPLFWIGTIRPTSARRSGIRARRCATSSPTRLRRAAFTGFPSKGSIPCGCSDGPSRRAKRGFSSSPRGMEFGTHT